METWSATLYNHRSGIWSARANGAAACSAKCGRPLHALTNNWTRGTEPANTPPPQSTTPSLYPVSIHQMAPPKRTSNCNLLLIYRPRKDERLSGPRWLTRSGRFTHNWSLVSCRSSAGPIVVKLRMLVYMVAILLW